MIVVSPGLTDNLITGPEAEPEVMILLSPVVVKPVETETAAPAPELREEARLEPHPNSTTRIVLREKDIKDPAPIRYGAMESTSSSSRQGLELLDD
jgi:hypothetical protein